MTAAAPVVVATPSLPTPSLPKLRTLGGQQPSPALVADLDVLLSLPEAVRKEIWEALRPSLPEPVPTRVESLLDAFCRRHGLADMQLARAVRVCRTLIREASRHDLDANALAQDLASLHPRSRELEDILLRGYEPAKASIRDELLQRTIRSNGAVLLDIEWRLDVLAASSHARGFRAPIALLTFRYEANGRQETITFQALPGAIEKLQQVCRELRS